MTIFDITPTIKGASPVFPGDAPLSIERTCLTPSLVSAFRMSSHMGAHVDAPMHLHQMGDVCSIELHRLIGQCFVLDCQKYQEIRPEHIPSHLSVRRLLLKTGFVMPDKWTDEFAYLLPETVEKLIDIGVEVIGIDTPSIDKADSEHLISHHKALKHGLVILENLLLQNVPQGVYTLVALPLKIEGLEASPIRAILFEKESFTDARNF